MNFESFCSAALQSSTLVVDVEQGESRGLMGMGLAFNAGPYVVHAYAPLNHQYGGNNFDDSMRGLLKNLIEKHPALIMHNAKYDLNVLEQNDFNVRGKHFYDTMLMQHWINENIISKDLDFVCKSHGIEGKNRSTLFKDILKQWGWDAIPIFMMEEYSGNDAKITQELFNKLLPLFNKQGFSSSLWKYEEDFVWLTIDIENIGIKVDLDIASEQEQIGTAILKEISEELDINPGSRIGLEELLINRLNLPILKVGKTGPSFDKKVMEQYDELLKESGNPLAQKILRYRGWQKTVTSNYRPYLNFADANGRIHPNYKLHGTVTGRSSCEKPNLQQIPIKSGNEWNGRLRDAFIPGSPTTSLISFDAAQLEFRLAAAYAKEEKLIELFNSGVDVFAAMADELSWLRNDTKTFTYTTLYGGGTNRVSNVFNVSQDRAQEMRSHFFAVYPGLQQKSQEAARIARQQGWIQYWTGRRRHFEDRQAEAHKAFNSAIQGGGFELIKRSMLRASPLQDETAKMVLQVHDEVVWEIENDVLDTKVPQILEALNWNKESFGVEFKFESKPWGSK